VCRADQGTRPPVAASHGQVAGGTASKLLARGRRPRVALFVTTADTARPASTHRRIMGFGIFSPRRSLVDSFEPLQPDLAIARRLPPIPDSVHKSRQPVGRLQPPIITSCRSSAARTVPVVSSFLVHRHALRHDRCTQPMPLCRGSIEGAVTLDLDPPPWLGSFQMGRRRWVGFRWENKRTGIMALAVLWDFVGGQISKN
jgi:hypothetical protein